MKKAVWLLIAAMLLAAASSCTESAVTAAEDSIPRTETSREVSAAPSAPADTRTPENTEPSVLNITIAADGLNVRRFADAGSDALATVLRGGVYRVLDEKNDAEGRTWYRIQTDNGTGGWVAAWFCRQTEEKTNLELVNSLLNLYGDGIQAKIEGSSLKIGVSVRGFETDLQSELPDRVFYGSGDTGDKNELLSAETVWSCLSEDGKRLFNVRCSIRYDMLEYLWEKFPEYAGVYGSRRLNDLARIDISAEEQGDALCITGISCRMKYDDPALLEIQPISPSEEGLKNGPSIGMTLREAYECLGGSFEDLERDESGGAELGGVRLANVDRYALPGDEVIWIAVESGGYATKRGMRIGDTAETVERLYGKPDTGFSGDGCVIYQVVRTSQDGKPVFCDNDTMEVCYKDGLVSAFSFTRMYLT